MTSSRARQEPSSDSTETPEEDLVASTLAYVRTSEGVVQVDRGGAMPAGAVPEFAAQLRSKGVFVTAAELAELDAAQQKQD